MRRRRLLASTAICAWALAMLAGCTLLIDFQEVASVDGGPDTATPIGPPDVRVDSDSGLDAPGDTARSDGRDATGNPDACKGHPDGKYCGGDQITWPSKEDLVTCKGGQILGVRFCATGQGCLQMLNGSPDECDECANKIDGMYCGRDLPGWDTSNAQFLLRCQTGRVVTLRPCPTTCKSAGVNSACQ